MTRVVRNCSEMNMNTQIDSSLPVAADLPNLSNQKWKWGYLTAAVFLFISCIIYCETIRYYLVISQCKWPQSEEGDVKAMILADPHLLGPNKGHWYDKLRREWQMKQTFRTSMLLFEPEVVFILGDLFDEGDAVTNKQFDKYIANFHDIFKPTSNMTRIISIVGNHDVGFHYAMHPKFITRFDQNFNNTRVTLITIKEVHFVIINSMAMENDGCYFCATARKDMDKISRSMKCMKIPDKCGLNPKTTSKYSRPVIMQHFPTYRSSDEECIQGDIEEIESYRENWEVLSKESTRFIGSTLNPRVAFSGHSHHYCHTKNSLGIDEYTVASFSWRNKDEPSFLLATFSPHGYNVNVCYIPNEHTQTLIYSACTTTICLFGVLMKLLAVCLRRFQSPTVQYVQDGK